MLIKTHEHATELLNLENTLTEIRRYFHGNSNDICCFNITNHNGENKLETYYYVGVDWLNDEFAVYVAPKVNKNAPKTDFIQLLFSCANELGPSVDIDKLLEIKFNKPFIQIPSNQDLLSPLLIVYYLQLIHVIVKKGLKNTYYKVIKNLNSRIKGKLLISNSLKKNQLKGRALENICSYDEFGLNHLENKILKKALLFSKRYIAGKNLLDEKLASKINYCLNSFSNVDDKVSTNEIKQNKENPLFKEYKQAITIAKLILNRFGYNESSIDQNLNQQVSVPPFWINMPMLFELYALSKLKSRFGNAVKYHVKGSFEWEPDYLLSNDKFKLIIDAKYKPSYKNRPTPDDIRQLSGYSRDIKILRQLGLNPEEQKNTIVDCLIIYVDNDSVEQLPAELLNNPINEHNIVGFYKVPLKLPIIHN